ncbi:hypothetical protein [Chitinophaga caseinilytica]|uniref:hypothetical protein n=1 Tax=Chitinophaga caseinilytica TaxID=2267521 RepID=UPI003C2BE8C0
MNTTTKHTIRSAFFACLMLLAAAACRKEEFQQQPHGEPMPYADTARHDVRGLLAVSPFKLFDAAWRRSHMDELMASKPPSMRFTILAADDAAMTAAGFSAAGIAAASPETLDSMLRFHVLVEAVDTTALRLQTRNVGKKTLFESTTLQEMLNRVGSNVTYPEPYNYRQFISAGADGELIVNGKHTGSRRPLFARNGVVWPVNRVLEFPRQHALDYLASDPRFSLFVALEHWCDSVWTEASWGYFQRTTFSSLRPNMSNGAIQQEMFLAPTNEAFAAAGFRTLEDLVNLNMRSLPYMDMDWFEMRNGFVTDTLLSYHGLGRMYAPVGSWGPGAGSMAVFFSSDLNASLSGFVLNVTDGLLPPYYMPLVFSSGNGKITIRLPAGTHTATVTDADIRTLEGPIHAVDRLIIPANLQLP